MTKEELREKIEGMKIGNLDPGFGIKMKDIGYNQALEDILELIK